MRRRALLAASAASGGGDAPFRAEFFFDYCEEDIFWFNCYRAPDSLGRQCYEKARELIEKYGIGDEYVSYLTNPIDYGFEVYIEGNLCTSIYMDYELITLNTDGAYDSNKILNNGELQFEGLLL